LSSLSTLYGGNEETLKFLSTVVCMDATRATIEAHKEMSTLDDSDAEASTEAANTEAVKQNKGTTIEFEDDDDV
jgi:hypothetical protein